MLKFIGMASVLITGMSGTGEFTALELLRERGHAAMDTDTDAGTFSQWMTLPHGSADWIWREYAITDLTDQGRFYPMFAHIVLLSAPVELLLRDDVKPQVLLNQRVFIQEAL